MAQLHIILWWSIIGLSCLGAKEWSILSLIIASFVSACLAPSKPPSSCEAIISFCNCCMKHSSKSFGTLRFTPDSTFRCYSFNDFWKYFGVLKMAQPYIILWWSVIGSSWGGAKELSIVSLIITSFILACLDPSEPPSSGEVMSSLWNCRVKHSSKSFGTLRFTPDSTSVIGKLSFAIGDSLTFEFFSIHWNNFCLNALLTFFRKMHGLINHFTSVLWTWAIKCPHFVEAFFWQYALDMLYWSKSSITWTPFWSDFFDGYDTMDTILDMAIFLVFCLF